MISFLAQGFVVAGALILIVALVPVRRLIGQLPLGPVRSRWYGMTVLIVLFLIGYLGYAGVSWNSHRSVLDLIVPGVFFFGACFVWLTANLSLQTTLDVMRISLLERETVTDPLTGIFNRRYLDRRLIEEVARARRYRLPLSIMMFDIDHFKQINDGYGHPAGDKVLASLAEIVAKDLRESDVVARYGGEEFIVIAPHTEHSNAIEVAERLRRQIESHSFSLGDEPDDIREINVTTSIGVASLSEEVNSVEKLIHAADAQLYRAKHEGRNQVCSDTTATPA